jgi:hypothetical protein
MKMITMLRYLSAIWGLFGVIAFLGYGVLKVSSFVQFNILQQMSFFQWTVLFCNVIFMAYCEGYRGFQQSFSPRVAARILYLSKSATFFNGLLAPLFCIGYFGSNQRRQITSLVVTLTIMLVIMVVSRFPQPWRGIVDAGVMIGLVWGMISLLVYIWIAFSRSHFPHSPELSIHYAAKQ